jgi:hypothetical protein
VNHEKITSGEGVNRALLEDIESRGVKAIEEWIVHAFPIDDEEVAHVSEDVLYVAVLAAIARSGSGDSAKLADAALGTQMIDFCRYYS